MRPCGARSVRSFVCAYNRQRSRGIWGHALPGKFVKFRPYESASEAVGDHHNHTKFMANGL